MRPERVEPIAHSLFFLQTHTVQSAASSKQSAVGFTVGSPSPDTPSLHHSITPSLHHFITSSPPSPVTREPETREGRTDRSLSFFPPDSHWHSHCSVSSKQQSVSSGFTVCSATPILRYSGTPSPPSLHHFITPSLYHLHHLRHLRHLHHLRHPSPVNL